MSDEAAFLDALRASPTDDTTRLVFADWLDENDQPRKAAYLRLVAALARAGGDLTDRPEGEALTALIPELPDDWRFATGSRFVVTLFSYGYAQKINMIKHLREVTGRGLAEAKGMSEALPCRVRDGLMFDRARDITRQLRNVPEAVVAVLPSEQEELPFGVSSEVVVAYTIWGQPADRARVEGEARAALAGFLERALKLPKDEAAEKAQSQQIVLYRNLTNGGAEDHRRVLTRLIPPFAFTGGWSMGVFVRHVATEVE